MVVANFKGGGHPFFSDSSALDRGLLNKKGGRSTIHFSAGNLRTQCFLFRTVHSANQLSIYGAVADWCGELAQQKPGQSFLSMEKSDAKVNGQLCRKLELEEVNTVGSNTWDKCSSSERSIAYPSSKIRKVIK